MNRGSYLIRLITLLSIFWLSLTQSFTAINMVTGFAVVMLSVYYYSLFCRDNKVTTMYPMNSLILLYYFIYLVYSMFKASFVVIYRMIQAPPSPAILILPTKLRGELSIAILSMSITLTPGTITIDYQEGVLHVLCMYSNLPLEVLEGEVLGNYEELLYKMEQNLVKDIKNKPMGE